MGEKSAGMIHPIPLTFQPSYMLHGTKCSQYIITSWGREGLQFRCWGRRFSRITKVDEASCRASSCLRCSQSGCSGAHEFCGWSLPYTCVKGMRELIFISTLTCPYRLTCLLGLPTCHKRLLTFFLVRTCLYGKY